MARVSGSKDAVEHDLGEFGLVGSAARDPSEGRPSRPAPTQAGAYRHCIRCGSRSSSTRQRAAESAFRTPASPLFRLYYQVEIRHCQIPSSKIPQPAHSRRRPRQ